jgi:uncharacterized protein YqjF (DUF2071 family)
MRLYMPGTFLTAEWRYLVMLNYEIDPHVLLPILPRYTELDCWQGKHFVSVVGFLFLNTRVLGIPIPFHRNFEEVNLRFYVRRRAGDEWRRGVVFIKEVVPRSAIANVARWVYNENYVCQPMSSSIEIPTTETDPGRIEYRWGREPLRVWARIAGLPKVLPGGSEAEFITEHYWGYARQRDGGTMEYRVEHPPWRVWQALDAKLEGDVTGFYGAAYGEALAGKPSSTFVAEGSPIAVYRGVRIN